MLEMEGYRFSRPRSVEFRDVDVAGHVNNAVYLTYLETARIAYLGEVLGLDFAYEVSLILAARVPSIGTKSFDMQHEVRGEDGRRVLEASSVLVAYDYAANEPIPVPDDWRKRLEAYEERSSVPS
jgi:acyl-CoA thioester hydrolase